MGNSGRRVNWNYGDAYKQYNMDGDIHIGTGVVRVHDIFNPLPAFMCDADVIFSDPPYNSSALSGYYTKAGIQEKPDSFGSFFQRFMECIREIHPRIVCIEAGLPQTDDYVNALMKIYARVTVRQSWYYRKQDNKCSIVFASDNPFPECIDRMPPMDEEQVIDYLCKNLEYKCIGDLCMGKGLVGYYSNKYGKPFVGTELNSKRLAVCVERVTKNQRGKIL